VAKSICHHAKFRATLIGGGVRMRPQEDALNAPIDMLVGTPGRLLKHIEDGNMAYGDLKYVVSFPLLFFWVFLLCQTTVSEMQAL
jgi:superfamily II DNA/RNA helicase